MLQQSHSILLTCRFNPSRETPLLAPALKSNSGPPMMLVHEELCQKFSQVTEMHGRFYFL